MLKKSIIGFLALTMAVSCLSGCNGKPQGKNEVGKNTSSVKINGDKIYPIECDDTLTFWTSLSTTVSSRFDNFGDTPLAKETEKRTGVKIEYVHPSAGQDAEQLQLLIASDELPDMVGNAWNRYPGGPQTAIDDGYILKLNDLIDKYAPALKKTLSENQEQERLVKNDGGNYYAFPFLLQEGILQVFYGPIIREDWLAKVNMERPETIDEWEAVLTAFKDKCGARAPFSGNMYELQVAFSSAFNIFTEWYINDGKVVFGAAEPGYKEFLMKLNDWYNKGLIDKDLSVVTSQQIRSSMLNNEIGAITGYAGGGIGDLMQAAKATGNSGTFSLVGAKYPVQKKGQTPEYGNLASTVNMNYGVALGSKCKNPELATRFLDYGFTEEGHNLYNFGIEGESYEWKDGYPTYTKAIVDNDEGVNMTDAMGAYMKSAYNGIMVQDQRYIEQYYQLPQQKEAQITWGITNMKSHLLPQIYIDNSERDKDDAAMTNITTYVDEMAIKFVTGAESFDKYDAYLQQLETFGLSDAKKFRQNAYERYLSR